MPRCRCRVGAEGAGGGKGADSAGAKVPRVPRVLRVLRVLVPRVRRVLVPTVRRVLVPTVRRVLVPMVRRVQRRAVSVLEVQRVPRVRRVLVPHRSGSDGFTGRPSYELRAADTVDELRASTFDGKHPLDAALSASRRRSQAAISVISVVFGREVKLESAQNPPCFDGRKGLVERRRCMRRQIVEHDANALGLRVVRVDQVAHALGEVDTRTMVDDFGVFARVGMHHIFCCHGVSVTSTSRRRTVSPDSA
jgi:hypothetical protein